MADVSALNLIKERNMRLSSVVRSPSRRDWVFAATPTSRPEPAQDPTIRVADIIKAVSDLTGYSLMEIVSQRREMSLTHARFIVCHLSKVLTSRSYPEVGRMLGGRDHTTIMHGVTRAAEMIEASEGFAALVEACRMRVLEMSGMADRADVT